MIEKWREKDDLMEKFYRDGEFVDVDSEGQDNEEKIKRGGRIEFEIQIRREDYVRLISVTLILLIVGIAFNLLYNHLII